MLLLVILHYYHTNLRLETCHQHASGGLTAVNTTELAGRTHVSKEVAAKCPRSARGRFNRGGREAFNTDTINT